MDFCEQLKKLRADNGLTQEQLADALNVSRQAVSSWENGRNLPDLEMVVRIAAKYGLSLDRLILGDEKMSKKLVRDSSETRRINASKVIVIIAACLLLIGAGFVIAKGFTPEYIDSEGFLHESFYLLPIGFFFMFCGLLCFLAAGVRGTVQLIKKRRGKA